jgi:beta-glucanase (GH16 family)
MLVIAKNNPRESSRPPGLQTSLRAGSPLAHRIWVCNLLMILVVATLGFAETSLAALDRSHSRHSAKRRLVWSDDFNGEAGSSPDPTKWNFDIGGGGWGSDELQYYTSSPSNAALDGQGDLVLTARAEKYSGADGVTRHYTSARLQTLNRFQFTYGLVEARIRVPRGDGLLPAFWALGSDAYYGPHAWPACGEIDAMEVLGSAPRVLHGTIHGPWPWAPGGIGARLRSPVPLSDGFHTYGVRWSPSQIAFMLDGTPYRTLKPSDLRRSSKWPFEHPFFLLLNLTVGGDFAGPPGPSTQFPSSMTVDWVRVWQ